MPVESPYQEAPKPEEQESDNSPLLVVPLVLALMACYIGHLIRDNVLYERATASLAAAKAKAEKGVDTHKLDQAAVDACLAPDKNCFRAPDMTKCKEEVTACLQGLLKPTAGINSATPENPSK